MHRGELSKMLSEIEKLREIARCCMAGEQLDDHLSQWFAQSLDDYLNHRCSHLSEAFGLRGAHGGVPWWREEAIRKRNAALVDLAAFLPVEGSATARARRIKQLCDRYAASSWPRDRERDEMPQGYAGTLKACLWCAFKSGASMPVGERHLRNILPV